MIILNEISNRLIISQAMVEDFVLISSDEKFKEYDIKLLWKES
jgi:PIN domain nuclease of toxin-antitoxin system